MRALFFDLIVVGGLMLLVLCGVQTYQRFFYVDPIEDLMNHYGAPAAGNPATITEEWAELEARAKILSITTNNCDCPK